MVTVLEGCDHDDSKRKCFIYFSDEYAFIITDGKIFEESLLTSLDFPNEKASQVLRKLLYSFAEKTNVFVYRGYKIG
jgi:hypothetical protein